MQLSAMHSLVKCSDIEVVAVPGQLSAGQFSALQTSSVEGSSVQYSAIQCNLVQYSSLFNIMQQPVYISAVPCKIIRIHG